MEMMNSTNQETYRPKIVECMLDYVIKRMAITLKAKVMEIVKTGKKIGEDDPRTIVHSMKVGLALTLVSLFYYFRPLYDGFGTAGMWAILTVVVVFEFTVGGTLSKSLNRGCATLLAGALGIGAEYLANLCGEKGEPVILGLLVFLLATTATFTRFIPSVKKKYDYGVLIFIITFTLVAVSGFRVSQILQLAHQRLSTILIGGATCMVISIFVCPVWAGQDLHNLVAANIDKLAVFLEGFGGEFSSFPGDEIATCASHDNEKPFHLGYKSVLDSKATEESLANFAWWEPCHGRFKFRHPWKQYLTVGVLAMECACQIKALDEYIHSRPQVVASDFHRKIQEICKRMSLESGKALKELSSSIKNLKFPPTAVQTHLQNSNAAADELKTMLKKLSVPKQNLQEIMQLLVVAHTLINIIKLVEKISVSAHELSQKAGFRKQKSTATSEKQLVMLHHGIVKPFNDMSGTDDRVVVVDIGDSSDDSPDKDISIRPLDK